MPKKPTAEELRKLKRDHLSRELAHGIKARKVLEEKWRKINMSIKVPELMTELEVAWRNAEHVLDMKDYIISILLDELDGAEEQYLFNYRAHCDSIHNIYRIYLQRLYKLKEDYNKELKFYQDALKLQMTDIKDEAQAQEEYMKTMIHGLEKQEKNIERIERSEYMSKLNELEQKYLDDTYLRRNTAENWFENIWRTFVKYIDTYNNSIVEVQKDYKERMEKDITVSKIIKTQAEKLYQLNIFLRVTKDQQMGQEDKFNTTIKDLNDEYNYWHNLFFICRRMFAQDTEYDAKVLTTLVLESNQILKKLEKHIKLAEKILTIYSISGKRETKNEKILPFPKLKPRMKVEYDWGSIRNLTYFWQKCAVADTTRNNIHDEYYHLLQENIELKETIRKCINYECNHKRPPLDDIKKKRLQSQSHVFVRKC